LPICNIARSVDCGVFLVLRRARVTLGEAKVRLEFNGIPSLFAFGALHHAFSLARFLLLFVALTP
jgi:hypothetical protein